MSGRLPELEARIEGIRQLGTVVRAMRGVAAARAQQARRMIGGMRGYTDIVGAALSDALRLLPGDAAAQAAPGRRLSAVVLVTAERGFVGTLAEQVLRAAEADRAAGQPLFGLGTRGVALARAQGWNFAWDAPMAAQAGAIAAIANRVADRLYAAFLQGQANGVVVIYPRAGADGRVTIERRRLLPLDLDRFRGLPPAAAPLAYLAPRRLVELLTGEYFFAELAHAVAEGLAAENAARLATLQGAHANIERRLDQLAAEERRGRQEAITSELLDLLTGALAVEPPAGFRRG